MKLKQPGRIALGYAFLQPGDWGRFKGLPVRKDVAEGLLTQGITVLRYGGLMNNAPEYRWKKALGPRDLRQPYKGYWYPQTNDKPAEFASKAPLTSNGFGIIDFMNFCEAAKILGIPAFNVMEETPQDMADFVEYANGSADTTWGKRRVEDGIPNRTSNASWSLATKNRSTRNIGSISNRLLKRFGPRIPKSFSLSAISCTTRLF